jgi:hypothetical protein
MVGAVRAAIGCCVSMGADEFVVCGPWTNTSEDCVTLTCPHCDTEILNGDGEYTLAELRSIALAHACEIA